MLLVCYPIWMVAFFLPEWGEKVLDKDNDIEGFMQPSPPRGNETWCWLLIDFCLIVLYVIFCVPCYIDVFTWLVFKKQEVMNFK